MEQIVYCVDLDKSLEVLEYSGENLAYDMEHYNVADPILLSDPDRKVFRSEAEAEAFLERYIGTLERLPEICQREKGVPCLLYKRRYIVQAIMKEKTFTQRKYRKNWEPGQLFQFHDQVNFLTVRLTSLTQTIQGAWKYCYELPE